MFHVFQVETASVVHINDANISSEKVSSLQKAIECVQNIPVSRQVLIVSGGILLKPEEYVHTYSAGVDSNPVFLFDKGAIVQPLNDQMIMGPSMINDALLKELYYSMKWSPSLETVARRAAIVKHCADEATQMYEMAEQVVHNAHLQHLGWQAVLANLYDMAKVIQKEAGAVNQMYVDFLSHTARYHADMNTFPATLDLLSRIPIVPSLIPRPLPQCGSNSGSTSGSGSGIDGGGIVIPGDSDFVFEEQQQFESPKNLLQWIEAQDPNMRLADMHQRGCHILSALTEDARADLQKNLFTIENELSKKDMTEIYNLNNFMSALENNRTDLACFSKQQQDMAKGMEANRIRAETVSDVTVLPDLCASHRQQLEAVMYDQKKIHQRHNNVRIGKVDMCNAIHFRLGWLSNLQQTMTRYRVKLITQQDRIQKAKKIFRIIRQVSCCPTFYTQAIIEVSRRRKFTAQYRTWAESLSGDAKAFREKEMSKRQTFEKTNRNHFILLLFPGIEDTVPEYASVMPEEFDHRLPPVTDQDITYLKTKVPELQDLISSSSMTDSDTMMFSRVTSLGNLMRSPPSLNTTPQQHCSPLPLSQSTPKQDAATTTHEDGTATHEAGTTMHEPASTNDVDTSVKPDEAGDDKNVNISDIVVLTSSQATLATSIATEAIATSGTNVLVTSLGYRDAPYGSPSHSSNLSYGSPRSNASHGSPRSTASHGTMSSDAFTSSFTTVPDEQSDSSTPVQKISPDPADSASHHSSTSSDIEPVKEGDDHGDACSVSMVTSAEAATSGPPSLDLATIGSDDEEYYSLVPGNLPSAKAGSQEATEESSSNSSRGGDAGAPPVSGSCSSSAATATVQAKPTQAIRDLMSPSDAEVSHSDSCPSEFYIDESLPSSLTESPEFKKIQELEQQVQGFKIQMQEKLEQLKNKNDILEQQNSTIAALQDQVSISDNKAKEMKNLLEASVADLRESLMNLREDVKGGKCEFDSWSESCIKDLLEQIKAFEEHKKHEEAESMKKAAEERDDDKRRWQEMLVEEKQKILALETDLAKQTEEAARLKDEITTVISEADAKVKQAREEMEEGINDAKTEFHMETELELENVKSEMQKIIDEKETQLEDLHVQLDRKMGELDELRTEIQDGRTRTEELKQQHSDDSKVLVEKHQHEMEILTEQLSETIAEEMKKAEDERVDRLIKEVKIKLENEYETSVIEKDKEHFNDLSKLKEEMEGFKETALNDQRQELEEIHYAELKEQRNHVADLEEQLQLINDKYDDQKETLRCQYVKQYEQELEQQKLGLTAEFENEVSELEAKVTAMSAEKCEMMKEHEEAIVELMEQIEERKNEAQLLQESILAREQETEKNLRADFEEFTAGKDSEIQTLKSKLCEMSEEYERRKQESCELLRKELMQEHDQDILQVQEGYRQKIDVMKLEHEDNIAAIRSSIIADKQVIFNEAIAKLTRDKDEIITSLRNDLHIAQTQLKDIASSPFSKIDEALKNMKEPKDYNYYKRVTRTLKARHESELNDMLNKLENCVTPPSADELSGTASAPNVSGLETDTAPVDMSSSVVPVSEEMSSLDRTLAAFSSEQPWTTSSVMTRSAMSLTTRPGTAVRDTKLKLRRRSTSQSDASHSDTMQQLPMLPRMPDIAGGRVAISTCEIGDLVLLCLDERHNHYVVFHVGSTLHFLHTDCLPALGLDTKGSAPKKTWVLAQITDTEYCQARKTVNRFKVPRGTKFFRVRARPWVPNHPTSTRTITATASTTHHTKTAAIAAATATGSAGGTGGVPAVMSASTSAVPTPRYHQPPTTTPIHTPTHPVTTQPLLTTSTTTTAEDMLPQHHHTDTTTTDTATTAATTSTPSRGEDSKGGV